MPSPPLISPSPGSAVLSPNHRRLFFRCSIAAPSVAETRHHRKITATSPSSSSNPDHLRCSSTPISHRACPDQLGISLAISTHHRRLQSTAGFLSPHLHHFRSSLLTQRRRRSRINLCLLCCAAAKPRPPAPLHGFHCIAPPPSPKARAFSLRRHPCISNLCP